MKASDLITNLTELIENHGDLEIIYAADDEGNFYGKVSYPPTPCVFKTEYDVDFEQVSKPTHICIN